MIKAGVVSALFGLWPLLATASTPTVTYGTYFDGTGDTNTAVALAADPSGNVVIVGYTTSQTLTGTAKSFQPTKATGFPNNRDIYIAKFDPSGKTLLWATFLGGDGDDVHASVAVDSSGSIYITGTTESTNFPLTSFAYLKTAPGPPSLYSFAAKVSADGTILLYSTYLPFDVESIGGLYTNSALAVNRNGEAFIAGRFTSPQDISRYVTSGALNLQQAGKFGVFLIRMNSAGTGLIFGAYLGGGGLFGSAVTSLTVDQTGNCYVAVVTVESSVPTTAQAFEGQYPNAGLSGQSLGSLGTANSGFFIEVNPINPMGSQVLYGTYFGPRFSRTAITQIGLDTSGAVYFSGSTNGTTFQVTPGAYRTSPGSGFISRLTLGAPALDSFSYLPSVPQKLRVGNQPQAAYVLLASQMTELTIPTLGAVSPTSSLTWTGFSGTDLVLVSPQSLWLVGFCGSCSLGNLISGNAFQAKPQSSGSSAVLIQVADVSLTISAVVNAATFQIGPISPGEIVTLGGTGLGPLTPAGLTLDKNGKVATALSGVQVLISGTPAPLTYVSATQINCVVPYEIQGLVSPYVEVSYQGQTSSVFPLNSAATAPALFTANGTGTGPAAALNQDQSYNSPINPAVRGSTVVLFMTGEGQTSPPGVTGKVTTVAPIPPLTPQPLSPVAVLVNGQPASVTFYGEAPALVAGVMQLNVQIPANAPSGNLPILVSVGGNTSQSGVTVSVQ